MKKFCIIIFLNSLSDIFTLACIIVAASSPTVYLSCGFLDVRAPSITFATSSGGDDLFSIIDLKSSLYLLNQ